MLLYIIGTTASKELVNICAMTTTAEDSIPRLAEKDSRRANRLAAKLAVLYHYMAAIPSGGTMVEIAKRRLILQGLNESYQEVLAVYQGEGTPIEEDVTGTTVQSRFLPNEGYDISRNPFHMKVVVKNAKLIIQGLYKIPTLGNAQALERRWKLIEKLGGVVKTLEDEW